jgi:hypothetical protein
MTCVTGIMGGGGGPRSWACGGLPRESPRTTESSAWLADELQQRRGLLVHHALLITKEGPLGQHPVRRFLRSLVTISGT